MLRKEKNELLRRLMKKRVVISEEVIEAFVKVPRENFLPPEYREYAYYDHPFPIGYGQTISAPHMVLLMTEKLELKIGHKVLEVGTGSGYQAALIAEIIAPLNAKPEKRGYLVTIERIPELARFAEKNLRKTGYSSRVKVIIGDGTKGYEPESPYDRIIVTAAAPKIPRSLLEQLKPNGIMVIPVGDIDYQDLRIVKKKHNREIKVKRDVPCLFVPLIGEEGWSNLS